MHRAFLSLLEPGRKKDEEENREEEEKKKQILGVLLP